MPVASYTLSLVYLSRRLRPQNVGATFQASCLLCARRYSRRVVRRRNSPKNLCCFASCFGYMAINCDSYSRVSGAIRRCEHFSRRRIVVCLVWTLQLCDEVRRSGVQSCWQPVVRDPSIQIKEGRSEVRVVLEGPLIIPLIFHFQRTLGIVGSGVRSCR